MRRKVVRLRGPLALRIVLVSQQKRTSYLGSEQPALAYGLSDLESCYSCQGLKALRGHRGPQASFSIAS